MTSFSSLRMPSLSAFGNQIVILPTRLVLRLNEGQVDPSSGAFTYQGTTVSGKQVSHYDLVFVGNIGTTKIKRA